MFNRAFILNSLKLAAIVCAIAIIFISVMPNNAGLRAPTLNDKINHIFGYSVLMALGVMAWRGRARVWFLAIVFVQSSCVEILQANMDLGRDGSWGDMVANVIGIGLGGLIGHGIVVLVRTSIARYARRPEE